MKAAFFFKVLQHLPQELDSYQNGESPCFQNMVLIIVFALSCLKSDGSEDGFISLALNLAPETFALASKTCDEHLVTEGS